MHCIQFLQDIAHEQKFDVTYVDIEEKSLSGKFEIAILSVWCLPADNPGTN